MPDIAEEPVRMPLNSANVHDDRIERLQELYPEAFAEGEIDFDRLKNALGEFVAQGRERYGLTWAGKADAILAIQTPSVGTLTPFPEESVNFDTTENLFIEGDNLEVLKLLQKSYFGKVKMIYIDPPYNTGNEFIYPDNFREGLDGYLRYSGQVDDGGTRLSTNTETSGRFHSKWLSMMYPRLFLARNLLTEDGVIFMSIGHDEIGNLLSLANEIFGEENLVSICSRVMKTGGQKGVHFSPCVDYIIVMARNIAELNAFREPISQSVIKKVYTKTATNGPRKGEKYRSMGLYQAMLDKRANQRFYIECPDGQMVIPPGDSFPDTVAEGAQVTPGDGDGVWRWTYPRYEKEKQACNVEFIRSDKTSLVQPDGSKADWNVYYKIWLSDRMEDGQLPGNILDKFESRHSSAELKALNIPFDFAKPSALIKFLMTISGVAANDITLDFFAGSASTAHAAMELAAETGNSYPFICVQLPEPTPTDSEERKAGYNTIADIAKERIRRVANSLTDELFSDNTDVGFRVFKLSSSNFKVWDGTGSTALSDLEQQLKLYADHILPDRTDPDVLYELILKSGLPLTVDIQQKTVADKTVYSIADGTLAICLANPITSDCLGGIAQLAPQRVICLDAAFEGNDQLKTNTVLEMKSHDIEFRTV
ncbi:MAG: site-specific DNA-methyltransferase [Planctomycetota bacterium]|nr:MAG: site-specific DNA-methyltransferase [Planctomycetota bacterium]REJ90354.1 MAG: site-specific DNA-methyltransferase [Planctomycetota bacterium]